MDEKENRPPVPDKTIRWEFPEVPLPDAPEYEIITPHIGKGGFGKVWIARNAIGQWPALTAVYQSNFGENRGPYAAEFNGLQRCKPASENHPGLPKRCRVRLATAVQRSLVAPLPLCVFAFNPETRVHWPRKGTKGAKKTKEYPAFLSLPECFARRV
jgi:hypothetical protein